MVLGIQGPFQYYLLRMKVIRDIWAANPPEDDERVPSAVDAFHNGYNVLPQIKSWHDFLRSSVRKTDKITVPILNLIDDRMLLSDPARRIKTSELCHELRRILREAEEEPKLDLPDIVLKTLVEVDEEASKRMREGAIDKASSMLEKLEIQDRRDSTGSGARSLFVSPSKLQQSRKSKLANVPIHKTGGRSGLLPDNPQEFPTRNIFQQREDLEKQGKWPWNKVRKRKPDKKLAGYFKNRDLVSHLCENSLRINLTTEIEVLDRQRIHNETLLARSR